MGTKKRRHPHALVVHLNRIAARDRLTNADIAKAVGCDVSAVSRWRKKKRQPKVLAHRVALEKFIEKRSAGK